VTLVEELETSGNWMFRWRSYLPLVFAPLIFSGLDYFTYPFGSHDLDLLWELLCLCISALGLGIRALTIGFTASGTSGRNTNRQVADSLNTTGMYSFVRNPLYLGNFLMVLGWVSFLRVWWIPLLYLLVFTVYYERIIFSEEMFLRRKFGEVYLQWASTTPLFFPRLRAWKSPVSPFSWKKVLRREYHGAMGVVVAFFTLEVASDLWLGHGFEVDLFWRAVLGLSLPGYLLARILHKHKKWLKNRPA
jgi:protein-S-isoprenylcysteine O-methyltransferase Ste14